MCVCKGEKEGKEYVCEGERVCVRERKRGRERE